jgi:phenylacetate-coenzyme A ligase PaaK-like adenylate-forming protein
MTLAATQSAIDPAALRAHAGQMLSYDGWSRERLVALQESRLRDVLTHAVEHSSFYRETLGPDAPETPLAELPTLSKPDLMENFDRVATDPVLKLAKLEAFLADAEPGSAYRGAYRVFATSGATGVPGLFVYSHQEFAHWIAVGLAALARAGVTAETRLIAIGAPSDVHITRQLFAAFQAGRQGVPRLSVTTPLAEMVEALNAYQPEALIAYASIVGALADEQLEGRLQIDPVLISTTSEVLTDEIEERIEAAWGQPPANAYAATEAPGIAIGSLDHVGMHVFEGSVVLEVVDESGEPVPPGVPGAKVLLTSLVNHAQPLIRYELTDAIVLAEGPDPSGRPYLRIARVDGRSGDILRFPAANGGEVAVHPYRLRSPFSAMLDIRQYQIVDEPDGLRVLIVPKASAPPDLPDRVRNAIARELEEAGAAPIPILVEPVDEIERDPGHAAKLKLVTSAR